MKRMKYSAVAAVLIAALCGVSTAASAVVVKGFGELNALGSGLALIDVRGVVKVRGAGFLVVSEEANVEVQGHGHVTALGDGRLLYEGFGRAVIRSWDERTRVEVAGAGLRLKARGRGLALLKGHGVFHTDDVDGRWGPDLEVEFDSEE